MSKIARGRLAGFYGMKSYTSDELYKKADWYEAQIDNPENEDCPRYLQRWANKIRKLARQKEKAIMHKKNQK